MKLKNITDIQGFFNVVQECIGNVYIVSSKGDCLNLKSELCKYVAFAEMLSNNYIKELELKLENTEDTIRFLKFVLKEGK